MKMNKEPFDMVRINKIVPYVNYLVVRHDIPCPEFTYDEKSTSMDFEGQSGTFVFAIGDDWKIIFAFLRGKEEAHGTVDDVAETEIVEMIKKCYEKVEE